MQEVLLIGRKAEAQGIVSALQGAGVLHLEPMDLNSVAKEAPELVGGNAPGADTEQRRSLERLLARTESTLAEIGAQSVGAGSLPPENEWASSVEKIALESNTLATRRGVVESDLQLATSFKGVVTQLANMSDGLEYSKRVALLSFTLDKPETLEALKSTLSAALADRFILETSALGELTVGMVAVKADERDTARAALSKARVGELRLPGRFDGMPLQDAAKELNGIAISGPSEVSTVRQNLETLGRTHGAKLGAIRNELKDRIGIFEAQGMGVRGKFGFAIKGFIPLESVTAFTAALEPYAQSVIYEMHDADEHHADKVPVKFSNSSYVSNFEFLLGISAPPRYGTFDPSWVVAVFFPLFFGFIIADIALGGIFLAVALWMTSQAKKGQSLTIGLLGITLDPKTLQQVGFVITVMSIWSIIWGFLTGELMGSLGEHLHLFYAHGESGLFPILFNRLDPAFANTIMLICLAIGIVYLLWSWGLKAQLSLKHKHDHHFWEAIGMLGGLVGLIFFSTAFLTKALSNPLLTLPAVAGGLVFLYGTVKAKNAMMPIELLSQGGGIISFSRLFAVGLASAILAKLATDLGWGLATSYGFFGAILGIIISLFVHVLALALTLIGHVMQPLRLHYLEFLNPTGFYQESGPKYLPFKRSSQK